MFEDISKMEEEVQIFRQNILASSQLVEGISSLVEETQKQQELMKQVSTNYQNEIQNISNTTIAKIEKLEANTSGEIKSLVEKSLSDTVQQISEANNEYISELAKTDTSIKALQTDLSDKYVQFSNRMEQAQVDKLLTTCSEMKKSMEIRSTLAIVGVIVVIVLEVVQLVIH